MRYTNPLVQCPRCDLGGDIGCPCCGGEGLLPLFEAEDWVEEQGAVADAMMGEDAEIVVLMDWMISLRECSEIADAE
jgi:hypothetical protein